MKLELFIALLIAALLFAPLCLGLIHSLRTAGPAGFNACNIGGTHANGITRMAEVAFATPHVLVQKGTADNEVKLNVANTFPLGTVADAVPINDPVGVQLLAGGGQTLLMVASEAVAVGDEVYTDAGGKVQDLPVAAGTYYKVGTALTVADADDDEVEVMPCYPVVTVVS